MAMVSINIKDYGYITEGLALVEAQNKNSAMNWQSEIRLSTFGATKCNEMVDYYNDLANSAHEASVNIIKQTITEANFDQFMEGHKKRVNELLEMMRGIKNDYLR